MASPHEELTGAIGRAAYFRPTRSRVREVLSPKAEARVEVKGREYPLHDVSMNGLSFTSTVSSCWQADEELEIVVRAYDTAVYEGWAKVVRVSDSRRGDRIALGLINGFLDIPEIQRHDEEEELTRSLAGGIEPFAQVPQGYRDVIAGASAFVQYYRALLDRHEARYRDHGDRVTDALADLERRAYEVMAPAWSEICQKASQAAIGFLLDREVLALAKQYTEMMLSPHLLGCPAYERGYRKPLGYAGDYKVMLYYYADAFEGSTSFDRVFHKMGVNHPLAAGVRTRSAYLEDRLAEEYRNFAAKGNGADRFRVMSLGCGPAREVTGFSRKGDAWPVPITWTLVDQEEEALSVAYQEGKRAVTAAGSDSDLRLLNLSFSQILKDPSTLRVDAPQQMIYCSGLFDYLGGTAAQHLLGGLYALLDEGGLLVVGNAAMPNTHFWTPELLTDWRILYRSEEDMHEMVSKLPEGAQTTCELEPGGAYYFLSIHKPR